MTKALKLGKTELLVRVRNAVRSGEYRILPHAWLRCSERDVAAPHIEAVLTDGRPVPARDRYDAGHDDWSYCFEGDTCDTGPLRVVVAFDDLMLVVTVVRLTGSED